MNSIKLLKSSVPVSTAKKLIVFFLKMIVTSSFCFLLYVAGEAFYFIWASEWSGATWNRTTNKVVH